MDQESLAYLGIDELVESWVGKGAVFHECKTPQGVTVSLLAFFDFEHLGAVFLAQTWDARDPAPAWKFVLVHWTPPSSADSVVLVHAWPDGFKPTGPPLTEAATLTENYVREFAKSFSW